MSKKDEQRMLELEYYYSDVENMDFYTALEYIEGESYGKRR